MSFAYISTAGKGLFQCGFRLVVLVGSFLAFVKVEKQHGVRSLSSLVSEVAAVVEIGVGLSRRIKVRGHVGVQRCWQGKINTIGSLHNC